MPLKVGDLVMVEMEWSDNYAIITKIYSEKRIQLHDLCWQAGDDYVWTWRRDRQHIKLTRIVMSFAGPVPCPSR